MRFLKILMKTLGAIFGVLVLLIVIAIISMRANISDDRLDVEMSSVGSTAGTDTSYLIFGGRKNTGLEVAKVLHARGDRITAFVRPSSDTRELEKLGAELVTGDASNIDEVRAAFQGRRYKAVVTTMGCYSCEPPIDFTANRNVAQAAEEASVKRVLLISSIGAGNSYDTAPLISRLSLSKILPLKTLAEEYLRSTSLDYTIVRPGGLKNGTANGHGYLSEDVGAFGFIDRADLARLLVACLDDDKCIGKTLAAADETRQWILD
jgi:uncharacterized protein YbjT (DUF2867 family)